MWVLQQPQESPQGKATLIPLPQGEPRPLQWVYVFTSVGLPNQKWGHRSQWKRHPVPTLFPGLLLPMSSPVLPTLKNYTTTQQCRFSQWQWDILLRVSASSFSLHCAINVLCGMITIPSIRALFDFLLEPNPIQLSSVDTVTVQPGAKGPNCPSL